jgi:hypothetical protein
MQEYSSSNPMAPLTHSERVLELGKKIVEELGLDKSSDTLGRWMAHYIAEKLNDVEISGNESRNLKMLDCASAIMELWKHRNSFPNGKQPFESYESILRTLEIFTHDNNDPRYFSGSIFNTPIEGNKLEIERWLSFALNLDSGVRALIRYSLLKAAKLAEENHPDWIGIAEHIATEEDYDLQIIFRLSEHSEVLIPDDPKNADQVEIDKCICKLEALISATQGIISELKNQK